MASSRIPGYIYLYTIWEDLKTNPCSFKNEQEFIDQNSKNLEIQRKRDNLLLETLTNLGLPRAPFPISLKDIVLDIFKSKTLQLSQLIIYLVFSETEHKIIKNGEISEFKDYDSVMDFLSDSKSMMVYTYKV